MNAKEWIDAYVEKRCALYIGDEGRPPPPPKIAQYRSEAHRHLADILAERNRLTLC